MIEHANQVLPSLAQTTYILPLLLLVTPLLYAFYNIYLHPLATYPGPPLWCAFRLRWVLALQSGDLHRILLDIHNKYGPVVRIAPNELSYIDPQAWKDIYQNPRIPRTKVWFPKLNDQPFTIMGYDEDSHARHKRAFLKGFGKEGEELHEETVQRFVGLMVRKWTEMCAGGEVVVNLHKWLDMVTFDVSGDLCFGSSFGSTEKGESHPWVNISATFGKGVALTASLNFYPGMLKLLKYTTPKKVREMFAYHRQLTEEKVKERFDMEARNDFVQSVLDFNEGKMRGSVTDQEILANMPIILFAGSETTAAALGSTLHYLLHNSEWFDKLATEIRTSFTSENDITASSTSNLPLLNAVLSESMRIGPPVVIGVPRCIGKSGEFICGKLVPEGTMVTVNQYPANRSTLNYEKPGVFDPSRFLGEGEAGGYVIRPFLTGRHVCLGERFAWIEMRLLMARLLWSFDLRLDEEGDGVEDWGMQKTFIFWQKEKMDVRVRVRE